MKIVTNFLEDVAGVGIFPTISFIIFFLFFIVVTFYVFRLDKNYIKEVAAYPTNEDDHDPYLNDIG